VRAVLVPVKAFRDAKHRLAPVLDDEARAVTAMRLGETVLAAAEGAPTFVVCDDDEVADWAVGLGAMVLFTPRLGLSGAVSAGVEHLAGEGYDHVVVAHADLPFAFSLAEFGRAGEVTLAPDRRLDGTNLAAVPPASGFNFAYGPGSFTRHKQAAAELGLTCRVVHDWRFAFDVDTPQDLALLADSAAPVHSSLLAAPREGVFTAGKDGGRT
jgi:2-phospho-L-lactate/phosphoenolpyruvate guanylyltransferase